MDAYFTIEIRARRFLLWPSWFPFGKATRMYETTQKMTWAQVYNFISLVHKTGAEVVQVSASENVWGNNGES